MHGVSLDPGNVVVAVAEWDAIENHTGQLGHIEAGVGHKF